MKKQDIYSYQLPHEKAEIYRIFKRYGFRDELGHDLTLIVEFIQLVDFYCKYKDGIKGGAGDCVNA